MEGLNVERARTATWKVVDVISGVPLLSTAALRAMGLAAVPLVWWVRPSVVELTASRCEVKIPLSRRTKNHLGVMYVGALVVGADLASAIIAMLLTQNRKPKVNVLFKDLHVEFLKRVEGDAHFACEDGVAIAAAVETAIRSGERINETMKVIATVPSKFGQEPVARFQLTLTLKRRG